MQIKRFQRSAEESLIASSLSRKNQVLRVSGGCYTTRGIQSRDLNDYITITPKKVVIVEWKNDDTESKKTPLRILHT